MRNIDTDRWRDMNVLWGLGERCARRAQVRGLAITKRLTSPTALAVLEPQLSARGSLLSYQRPHVSSSRLLSTESTAVSYFYLYTYFMLEASTEYGFVEN